MRKPAGIFVLIFLFPLLLAGQQKTKVDSLEHLLAKTKGDSTRLVLLKQLYRLHSRSVPEKAKVVTKQIIEESEAIGNKKGIATGYYLRGHYYITKSAFDSANYYLQKSLRLSKRIKAPLTSLDALEWIANIKHKQQERDSALFYIAQAQEIALNNEKVTNEKRARIKLNEARIYYSERAFEKAVKKYIEADSILGNEHDNLRAFAQSQIGLVYERMLKPEKARTYYLKAKAVYERQDNKTGWFYLENRLGNLAMDAGNFIEAKSYYTSAYTYFKSISGFTELEAICANLGQIHTAFEEYDQAERYFNESLNYVKETKNKLSLPYIHRALGNLFLAQNQFEKAEYHLNYSLQIAQETNRQTGLTDTYDLLIKLHKNQGDFKKAFTLQSTLISVQDSLKKKSDLARINEIEAKYQSEKKEQKILLLTSEAELDKQKAKNEKNLLITGLLILGIAVITLFVLFRNKKQTNDKLRQLESAKSRFFANISHEFRTPLTLISGPISNQLSKKKLSAEDRTDLGLVQRNADRLLNLVDQLLDLSKLEAGQRLLKLSKGDPILFLKHLIEPFGYQCQYKGLAFTSDFGPHQEAWYDQELLEKIVSNLLSNAIKYTVNRGAISFKAQTVSDQLFISVVNENSQLSEKELPQLFDRFYQNKSVNQGVGIGLSLVKELVQLSKGKIGVEKPSPDIVRFTVTLPINKTVYSKDEYILVEHSVAKKDPEFSVNLNPEHDDSMEQIDENLPLLLIVDDNSEIRYFIKSILQKDYRVLEAEDGKQGVEIAIETIPDLVISDVMMPIEDGIFLSNTLKKDERTSHIPIVLLTAKSAEEDELKGLKTGADAYMVKPFKEEKLRVVIEKLIVSRAIIQEKFSQQVYLKPKDIQLSSTDTKLLDRIQAVLDTHLTDPHFTATIFSNEIGLSRMHLHRKLKALTGFSTTEFIRNQRLKLSAQLLVDADVNISEVGYAVGFNQPSYFTKCFKSFYGCSPSEYSKQQKASSFPKE